MPNGIETERNHRGQWLDLLSAHMWWTALLAGSVLCVVALVMS